MTKATKAEEKRCIEELASKLMAFLKIKRDQIDALFSEEDSAYIVGIMLDLAEMGHHVSFGVGLRLDYPEMKGLPKFYNEVDIFSPQTISEDCALRMCKRSLFLGEIAEFRDRKSAD